MRLIILPPAAEELKTAWEWYEQARRGLGDELATEVERGLQRIAELPHGWTKLSQHTRRYRLNRFPYSIVYRAAKGEIVMVAFMHLHRKPAYWRRRLT